MTQSPRVHITNNLTVALIQQTLGEQTCLQRPHLTVSINIHKCNTKTRIKSCFSTFITSLHLTKDIDFNSQCLNSLFFSLCLCVLLDDPFMCSSHLLHSTQAATLHYFINQQTHKPNTQYYIHLQTHNITLTHCMPC